MTPLAIFAYRRPEHLRATLASLERCARLDECRPTVFCDGAKDAAEGEAVAATRLVANEWAARHRATVVERAENLGLAPSIISAVAELCAAHGRAIVVEDDLLLAPRFLDFLLTALDRYADAQRVVQISGYMFPVAHDETRDAFFLPMTTTWGWATWQRAWSVARWDAPGARAALADPATRRRFNLDGAYDYAAMLEQRLASANSSWGVLWQWHLFRSDALALHPRASLVKNTGFDDTATHAGQPAFAADAQSLWNPRGDFSFPRDVATGTAAFDRIRTLLAAQKPRSRRRLRIPFLSAK